MPIFSSKGPKFTFSGVKYPFAGTDAPKAHPIPMARMKAIEKMLQEAEREHMDLGSFSPFGNEKKNTFFIENQIVYAPTTPEEAVALLADIRNTKFLKGLSVLNAVDLGCGPGAFVDYMSEYLLRHTEQKFSILGIEKDADFILDAVKIAGAMGVRNVKFIRGDFTKDLKASDLKDKNFFYLNQNLKNEDLEKALNDFLPKIPAGAVLVTRYCSRLDVLNSDLFEKKYHPLEDWGEYGQDFTLFIRTGKA